VSEPISLLGLSHRLTFTRDTDWLTSTKVPSRSQYHAFLSPTTGDTFASTTRSHHLPISAKFQPLSIDTLLHHCMPRVLCTKPRHRHHSSHWTYPIGTLDINSSSMFTIFHATLTRQYPSPLPLTKRVSTFAHVQSPFEKHTPLALVPLPTWYTCVFQQSMLQADR